MKHSLAPLTLKNGGVAVNLNFLITRKATLVLRALNHGIRQQMLKLLDSKKKLTVTEIHVRLHLEQSVASQHLAILRNAKIVTTVRDGRFIYYSVNYEFLNEIVKYAAELVG
jgi:DNA-binding transcriptional ArsR family regulator